MKVSIITITYNSGETLEECIQSVAAQTYSNLEYIVVDGGSDDGSLSVIKEHDEEITRWVSEPDSGIYDAMNKGLAMATGDVVGFLHADDLYATSDAISKIVRLMEKENSDACYADLRYVNSTSVDKVVRKWSSGEYEPGAFLNGWMPPHPTFFVRKDIYDRHGGYRLDLGTAADYELMLRFIHKIGIRVSYLPETIIKMRTGGQSNASLKHRLKANRMDRKAWKVNGLKPRPHTLLMKPLRKVVQYF